MGTALLVSACGSTSPADRGGVADAADASVEDAGTAVGPDTSVSDTGAAIVPDTNVEPCATKIWDVRVTAGARVSIGEGALRFDGAPPENTHKVQVTQLVTGDFDAKVTVDTVSGTGCRIRMFVATAPVVDAPNRLSAEFTDTGVKQLISTTEGSDQVGKLVTETSATLHIARTGESAFLEAVAGADMVSRTTYVTNAPLYIGITATCTLESIVGRVGSFSITGGGDARSDEFVCDSLK